MQMKTKLIILLGIIFHAVLAFGAQITQKIDWNVSHHVAIEVEVNGTASNTSSLSPDLTQFKSFDTSLGTLESVTVNFVATGANYSVSGTNITADKVTGVAIDHTVAFAIMDMSPPTMVYTMPSDKSAQEDILSQLISGTSQALEDFDFNVYFTNTFTLEGELAYFMDDTFVLTPLIGTGFYLSGNATEEDNIFFTVTGSASGYFEIIYNYAPIPEPSEIATVLGVSAFVSMLILRRRAKN
jgi:hypothetical protein